MSRVICLFWGVPTNVGQVTSIRTLEKQIKRMRASEFAEVRELGEEMAQACAAPPDCIWDAENNEPLAPTLARHAEPDEYSRQSRADLKLWAAQNLTVADAGPIRDVDLIKPDDVMSEIVATLLYPVCDHPFPRDLRDGARLEQRAQGRSARCRGQIARQRATICCADFAAASTVSTC